MKRFAAVSVLALALTGCMTAKDQAAKEMANDDERCLSYGVPKGSPAYVQCRAQLDHDRSNVSASERFERGGGLVGAMKRASED